MNKEHEVLEVLKNTGILESIVQAVNSEVLKKNYDLKCELYMERNKHGLGYDNYKKLLHAVRNGDRYYATTIGINGGGYHVIDGKTFDELMEDRKKLKKIREVQ